MASNKNGNAISGVKKAQLCVWEYLAGLWEERNNKVHGKAITSNKWTMKLRQEARCLLDSKLQLGYREMHLLQADTKL